MNGDAKKIHESEVPMLATGFMTENEHGGISEEGAAEEREEQKHLFRNAVRASFGFLFIDEVEEERYD